MPAWSLQWGKGWQEMSLNSVSSLPPHNLKEWILFEILHIFLKNHKIFCIDYTDTIDWAMLHEGLNYVNNFIIEVCEKYIWYSVNMYPVQAVSKW